MIVIILLNSLYINSLFNKNILRLKMIGSFKNSKNLRVYKLKILKIKIILKIIQLLNHFSNNTSKFDMTQKNCDFVQIPEVDFNVTATGIKVESRRFVTPRFIPFDIKGKCDNCRSDYAEIDYCVSMDGIIIICNRLKTPRHIPFDFKYPLPNVCLFRVKMKAKVFQFQYDTAQQVPQNQEGDLLDQAIHEITEDVFPYKQPPPVTVAKIETPVYGGQEEVQEKNDIKKEETME